MPAIVLAVYAWVQMAVSLGQAVAPVVKAAKAFILSLFNDGEITKEQQDALFARIDEIARKFEAGELDDWWKVEPNPTTPEKVTIITTTVTQPAAQ
jgi:hypothetical protein